MLCFYVKYLFDIVFLLPVLLGFGLNLAVSWYELNVQSRSGLYIVWRYITVSWILTLNLSIRA